MRANSEYMSHRRLSCRILLEQVLKDPGEAFRAEWFERRRFEKRASRVSMATNGFAIQRLQKCAQLRIVGKLPHVDEAVSGVQFLDVRSLQIDRERLGLQ